MKFAYLYRSLQATAIASAALLMLPAGAQTTAADTPAPAVAPAAKSKPAKPRMQKKPHRAPRHSQRDSSGEPLNASRLATDRGATAIDYQRNALERCSAFKTPENNKACIERMRQSPQGSVEGGGLLWEYSYQVPANGS